LSHDRGKTHASFDDPNADLKVGCLVAGMTAGAGSIEDMDVLRHGAMPGLFGGIRAPSTLGSFLRSFTWGNVRQLDAVARRFLAELAAAAPLLPGGDVLAFIDMDSMQKRVYGHAKQGAGFGHRHLGSLPASGGRVRLLLRTGTCDDAGRVHLRARKERLMPVMPGAEPFFHAGGSTGVLLCHGFTGSPGSLRPWAEYLAAEGLTVSLPRLPGHGTTWQEMAHTRWEDWYAEVDRAYQDLRAQADEIFVMGLSMGACLALRMAELRGDQVAGLVLVNPSVAPDTKLFLLAPVLKLVVPSLKGIASDIKKEGVTELGYDRVPVRAAATLPQLWKVTQQRLGDVTQPVLVYLSTMDHVVGPPSMRALRAALPAERLTVRELGNSFHVATLDNDAGEIFAGSLEFVRAHSRVGKD
jgi:carboxylesterase